MAGSAAQATAREWFALADGDGDGALSGGEAVAFFQRSGLPRNTLAQARTSPLRPSQHIPAAAAPPAPPDAPPTAPAAPLQAALLRRCRRLARCLAPQVWELSARGSPSLGLPQFWTALQLMALAQVGAPLPGWLPGWTTWWTGRLPAALGPAARST